MVRFANPLTSTAEGMASRRNFVCDSAVCFSTTSFSHSVGTGRVAFRVRVSGRFRRSNVASKAGREGARSLELLHGTTLRQTKRLRGRLAHTQVTQARALKGLKSAPEDPRTSGLESDLPGSLRTSLPLQTASDAEKRERCFLGRPPRPPVLRAPPYSLTIGSKPQR